MQRRRRARFTIFCFAKLGQAVIFGLHVIFSIKKHSRRALKHASKESLKTSQNDFKAVVSHQFPLWELMTLPEAPYRRHLELRTDGACTRYFEIRFTMHVTAVRGCEAGENEMLSYLSHRHDSNF